MSDQNTALEIHTDFSINMEIGKDDVLAIAVSRYEQDLMARRKELESEFRTLSKTRKTQEKELDRLSKSFLDKTLGQDLQAACTALKNASMGTFSYEVTLEKVDLDARTARYNSVITGNSGSRYSRPEITAQGDSDLPQNLINLATELIEIREAIQTNCENRIEVKRDLDQIGTKERQAKAHMAIRTLSQTEDGQKFLAGLQEGSGLFLEG